MHKSTVDYRVPLGKEGKMNPRLEIVRLAYEDNACLWFRVPAKRHEAARAARIIGQYNEFDPAMVVRFLRALPVGSRFEIGREYSPVLYVHTPDWKAGTQEATILEAARVVGLRFIDEFDAVGIWHRLWWD